LTSSSRRLAATAALAVVALTAAACSTKLSTATPPSTTVAPTTTIAGASTPAQTKASDYRAQLTYLTVEHVYLLGRVTAEIVSAGGLAPSTAATSSSPTTAAPTSTTSSPSTGSATSTSTTSTTSTTEATTTTVATTGGPLAIPGGDDAAAALDKNSHDIADQLAQAQGYGSTFGDSFYQLWTQRITDFAAYTTAAVAKNVKGATKDQLAAATAALAAANASLSDNATALANLFHQTNKYLAVNTVDKSGVADELGPDNAAVTAFIDAQAASGSTAVANLVTAAELMRHTSVVFAAAAAKLDPDQYPGTPTGTAANLRASLTAALVDHVELAALTTDALAAGKDPQQPIAALNANTVQLENIVIVNFGDPAALTFASKWGSYISSLEAYAKSKAGGGSAPDLSGVGADIGGFFHAQAPAELSAALIGSDVQAVVSGLQAVVDDAGSQSPAVTALRLAAGSVPKLGSDLAEGLAELKPALYLP